MLISVNELLQKQQTQTEVHTHGGILFHGKVLKSSKLEERVYERDGKKQRSITHRAELHGGGETVEVAQTIRDPDNTAIQFLEKDAEVVLRITKIVRGNVQVGEKGNGQKIYAERNQIQEYTLAEDVKVTLKTETARGAAKAAS